MKPFLKEALSALGGTVTEAEYGLSVEFPADEEGEVEGFAAPAPEPEA